MNFRLSSGRNGSIDFGKICVCYTVAGGAATIGITIGAAAGVI